MIFLCRFLLLLLFALPGMRLTFLSESCGPLLLRGESRKRGRLCLSATGVDVAMTGPPGLPASSAEKKASDEDSESAVKNDSSVDVGDGSAADNNGSSGDSSRDDSPADVLDGPAADDNGSSGDPSLDGDDDVDGPGDSSEEWTNLAADSSWSSRSSVAMLKRMTPRIDP